jgi:hypothetical protein
MGVEEGLIAPLSFLSRIPCRERKSKGGGGLIIQLLAVVPDY